MRIFSTGWSDGVDGPGHRWVIYLKGCNLRCRWCANPEGISPEPEILFYPDRAPYAETACPYEAVTKTAESWKLDRERCAQCPDIPCFHTWRHPAFEYAGEETSVDQVVARASEFRPFFASDGGVTFGGGEPTLQADEILQTVTALRKERIHTVVETNAGTVEAKRFVGAVDLLICDLKCVSPDLHLEWTGAEAAPVFETLRAAAEGQPDLLVRVPLVAGMNDGEEETERIVEFLSVLAGERESLQVEVLRMHHIGEPKYAALGREYPMTDVSVPPLAFAEAFVARLTEQGLNASLGGWKQ